MDRDRLRGSFFPESQALITGGTFTIQNNDHSRIYAGEKGGYSQLRDAVSPNALHDSGHIFDPPKCHPGTRVVIIQEIIDWLGGVHKDTRDKGVAWLTGGAGAGKSAIGRTVCERCAEERTLLASFFFSSSDATRNLSKPLVATIAYQICTIDASVKKSVTNFIENDPHIFNKSLRTQFVSLVMEPLIAFYINEPHTLPCLIVIDGLDECVDKSSQRDILETITYLITAYPHSPVRFLVCSRPEANIRNLIHGVKMNSDVFTLSLSDDKTASEDIELYLSDNFNALRQGHTFKHLLPSSWPTEDTISQLIYKSSGQFIYASTVIRYIEPPDDMPHRRLEVILGLRPPRGDLPFAQLDALYTHILTTTKDPRKATQISAFIARYQSTCIPFVARYLELENEEVVIILPQLAAIVGRTREGDDVDAGLWLLHKSFEDFLCDQSRSQQFYVSFPDAVASDILRSIQIFSNVSNICQFQSNNLSFSHPPYSRHAEVFSHWAPMFGCSKRLKADLINALREFPITSFCKELYSSHTVRCPEFIFIEYLIYINFMLVIDHPDLKDTYNDYIAILAKYAAQHLPTDDQPGSLLCNLVFAVDCIKLACRKLPVFSGEWGWEVVWRILCYEVPHINVRPHAVKTFQPFLSKADHSRILSRAAFYCLWFLCDSSITKVEAERHLKVSGIEKNRKYSHPWKWHRQTSVYKISKNEKRPVLYKDIRKRPHKIFFERYAELPKIPDGYSPRIYSFALFDWKNVNNSPVAYPQKWREYLGYLEYVAEILPLAGRYPPLIDICKTKAFALMSTMFPAASRRARRAIAKYLERMESEDGAEIESQDDRNPEESDKAESKGDNSSRHYEQNETEDLNANNSSRPHEESDGEFHIMNNKIPVWNDDNDNANILTWSFRHFIRNTRTLI